MSSPDHSPDFIPFALPSIGPEEIAEVSRVLESGWLTTGKYCRRFETEFAEACGARHALTLNSGTAGLHLALEALGVGPGDRVLTVTHTFTATAEVIRYLGADPVFVDIDPQTLNLDLNQTEEKLKNQPGIKVLLPVHFGGLPCDMDRITQLAERYGVALVEDAAHAFPAASGGRKIGSISDATMFSFYVTKTLATGEGGMVCTNDDKLAERMKVMRLHGISKDVFNRYQSRKAAWEYEVIAPGFKYNMTDLAAAIGVHQLAKAEKLRLRREWITGEYNNAFQDLPVILPPEPGPGDIHSRHLYVLRLKADAPLSRDAMIEALSEAGIGSSVHFIPLHRHPYWRERYGLKSGDFPQSERCFQSCLSLPVWPGMTDIQVGRVAQVVCRLLGKDGG